MQVCWSGVISAGPGLHCSFLAHLLRLEFLFKVLVISLYRTWLLLLLIYHMGVVVWHHLAAVPQGVSDCHW
jgi:hypothetical protein